MPSTLVAILVIALEGCSQATLGSASPGTLLTVLVLCGPGIAFAAWRWRYRQLCRAIDPGLDYRQAMAGWHQRAAEHQESERARLSGQPEWGSAVIPAGRTDVFGGTSGGWQALLAVHGASLLADGPLLAIDLTGEHATATLTALARRVGTTEATYHLPQHLGSSGLLADLSPAQLAGAIAEALHSGSGNARTDRAVDARVLQQLAAALAGGKVTPQRLAAAVRVALGYPARGGLLSPAECELLAGGLFPAAYRDQVMASLVRLDAVLGELAAYAAPGWPGKPARLTCLALGGGPRTAASEILTALAGQWLAVQVTTAPAPPAVIIAGAEELTRADAEQLTRACQARRVPVTMLFRHLRDDIAALAGGGTTAFMRLGNHHDADQAAAYLGRRHAFVMSSYTVTRGGGQASAFGGGDGYGTSDSDGTIWSHAETTRRAYDYEVEPATLQNLPEYALLLADRTSGTLQVRAIECDPAISDLPGASSAPLPPPAVPSPAAKAPPTPSPATPAQYPEEWQDPDADDPQPAELPREQPEDVPWWLRGQPSGHWRP
jgi:hypothetical protein